MNENKGFDLVLIAVPNVRGEKGKKIFTKKADNCLVVSVFITEECVSSSTPEIFDTVSYDNMMRKYISQMSDSMRKGLIQKYRLIEKEENA